MDIELRERALHAELSEAEQEIVVQNPRAGIDIFFVHIYHETENDRAVGKRLRQQLLAGI